MSGRLGLRKKKKERGKTGENHDNCQNEVDEERWVVCVVKRLTTTCVPQNPGRR